MLGYISQEAQRSLAGHQFGYIVPDITRELGRALSEATIKIPLSTWLTVGALSALGGSFGAWFATKSRKAVWGGTVGGLLGGVAGVALVQMMNKPTAGPAVVVPIKAEAA